MKIKCQFCRNGAKMNRKVIFSTSDAYDAVKIYFYFHTANI